MAIEKKEKFQEKRRVIQTMKKTSRFLSTMKGNFKWGTEGGPGRGAIAAVALSCQHHSLASYFSYVALVLIVPM